MKRHVHARAILRRPRWSVVMMGATALALFPPAIAQDRTPPVNPVLTKFHAQFNSPKLVKVAPNVTTAFAYSYSNFSFIEGKTGLIVIDTGWFQYGMENALRDLRKVTKKPVVAILYTHPHQDHMSGARLALAQAKGDIPIIGPSHFDRQGQADNSALNREVQKRGIAQMGLLLPSVGQKIAGSGVGPAQVMGARGEVMPNRLIDRDEDVEIDGVRLTLLRTGGDLPETMLIYMPDTGVLFCSDVVGGIFPYHETPRFEIAREPRDFVTTLDMALRLNPEKVIPGHGRLLLDKADARHVMTVNRDVIQFMIDQIDRMVNDGMSAEQIVHELKLPDALAQDPDLQPYYHRVDWMTRAMIVKRVGFFTELTDLIRLDGIEENRRFLTLIGKDRMLATAREAAAGDPRWAARLATMVLAVDREDAGARAIRQQAYRTIAETTDSVNERNYLLTAIATEQGEIDWGQVLGGTQAMVAPMLASSTIIAQLPARILPDRAKGANSRFTLAVANEPALYRFLLRNAVLVPVQEDGPTDFGLVVTRDTLNRFYAGSISFEAMVAQPQTSLSGGRDAALRFARMVEVFDR
ncbi:MAG: alkyl sulfatase dimerization domain-containing protein [Sphingobium sp.]